MLRQGRLRQTLKGHIGRVLSVAFSPDGKVLASGSSDNTLRIWQLEIGGSEICFLNNTNSTIYSIVFKQTDEGETLLISGHSDRSVKCWKLIMVEEKPYLQLEWSTPQNALLCQDAKLEGAKELSTDNTDLLKQRGEVIGNPSETVIDDLLPILELKKKEEFLIKSSKYSLPLLFQYPGSAIRRFNQKEKFTQKKVISL